MGFGRGMRRARAVGGGFVVVGVVSVAVAWRRSSLRSTFIQRVSLFRVGNLLG